MPRAYLLAAILLLPALSWAEAPRQREEVFAFAQEPALARDGDRVTISFEVKGRCDVTVAIENAAGKIIRHLACGVLGERAPAPFAPNSLKQTLVWDGKDDQGKYVEHKDQCTVRVSLGLKPRFERSLFHYPQRRNSRFPPLMCAQPEGVYVYDGGMGIDYLRLFSHTGEYLRTVYPFPAAAVEKTQGLFWREDPGLGKRPVKGNFLQCTFLTSGPNAVGAMTWNSSENRYISLVGDNKAHYGMYGGAGAAMAVNNGRIALCHDFLNRLATNGTTGGLPLSGPKVAFDFKNEGNLNRGEVLPVPPRSTALSPDGKTLYLTGFVFARQVGAAAADIILTSNWDAYHAVMKMDMAGDKEPVVFTGSAKLGDAGNGPGQLNTPSCVTTDGDGRVYIADYANNRVQVFAPDGKLLKTIQHTAPAWVRVHPKTGEVYVFSWMIATAKSSEKDAVPATLTRYTAMPETRHKDAASLPDKTGSGVNLRYGTTFYQFFAELDGHAETPMVWLVQDWAMSNVLSRQRPMQSGIEIYKLDGGKLTQVRAFEKELEEAQVRPKVHNTHRQRIYANPLTGNVFLTEGDSFLGKAFKDAWELDPQSGKCTYVKLPFDAEDMCFDTNGLAYLRSIDVVGRFLPAENWREVPWDYGAECASVFTSSSGDSKKTSLHSGLLLPANGGWHHGGMWVNALGSLSVVCGFHPEGPKGHASDVKMQKMHSPVEAHLHGGAGNFKPVLYPGRSFLGRGGAPMLHTWDAKGHPLHRDVLPGLAGNTYGIGSDSEHNLYVMASDCQFVDGKRHFNDVSGTIIKVRPGQGRVLSNHKSVPVPLHEKINRAPDLDSPAHGQSWIEGAEWFYGGVGFDGKNAGVGCACWNARMTFDYFNRTFAPEIDRYSVAVLDGSGNVILRLGRFGNTDDGAPLMPDPAIPYPQSIGGDEVALMHGAYLATHTDRRLFIADPGNARIISVLLGYQTEKRLNVGGK